MNQWLKTGIFTFIALFCVALAWFFQPRPIGPRDGEKTVGQVLFKDLTDPEKVHSLEILEVDSEMTADGGVSEFKVAQVDGRWVIPSHQNYPADAEDQMATAANALIGVETISVATDVPAQHKTFGVVEPDPEETSAADEGVGKLIVMKDKKGKDLAKLIIGKKVADTEDQRFVRRPGQDRVYTAAVDVDAFSTRFEDWIERDLLDLSPSDIRKVRIRDYSFLGLGIDMAGQIGPKDYSQRLDMILDWDQDDFKWKINQIKEFRNNRLVETELLDDEELDTSKLNDMKWALDDLKIVDVQRKPKGVGADLRANEELLSSQADFMNLANKGFLPVIMDGQLDLLSSDGEISIRTEDAVEYLLRFGNVKGMSGEGDDSQLNRYLFVTARLDEDALQPPELERLPEAAESEPAGETGESDAGDESATTGGEDTSSPTEGTGSTDSASEEPDVAAETTDESAASDEAAEETGAETDTPATDDAGQPGPSAPQGAEGAEGVPGTDSAEATSEDSESAGSTEAPAAGDETPAETDAATEDAAGDTAEGESDEPAAGDAVESSAEEESTPDEPIDIEAERERIVKDNKRKMDEYDEKRKKAEKKVRELNARFADWYFVISDDVYKKIHLSRSDVIKEKEDAAKEGSGLDAFRDLEGGIDAGTGDDDN